MDKLISYAMSFLGTPYKWGGANRLEGLDCSGFVQEVLRSVGIDPPGDQTAQELYNKLEPQSRFGTYGAGCLAFYGKSLKEITHVALMIDQYRIIEAAGGGSKTLTLEDAKRDGACVRIRLLKHRNDFVGTLKPNYVSIGLI